MNDHTPLTPTEGPPELTHRQFMALSAEVGGGDLPFTHCTIEHAFAIAQAAYRMGADEELCNCAENPGLFTELLLSDRRLKPPSQ